MEPKYFIYKGTEFKATFDEYGVLNQVFAVRSKIGANSGFPLRKFGRALTVSNPAVKYAIKLYAFEGR
jgi:hypothetical protein